MVTDLEQNVINSTTAYLLAAGVLIKNIGILAGLDPAVASQLAVSHKITDMVALQLKDIIDLSVKIIQKGE